VIQNAVSIEGAKIGGAAMVHSRVESIRLAAPFFADHEQAGVFGAYIEAANGPAGQARPGYPEGGNHGESGQQAGESFVRGAVVHHADVDLRVVRLQHGAHRIDNHILLVPSGDNNGYRRRQRRVTKLLETLIGAAPPVQPHRYDRKKHQDGIGPVADNEVCREQQVEEIRRAGYQRPQDQQLPAKF
jgi:hypothetical protein